MTDILSLARALYPEIAWSVSYEDGQLESLTGIDYRRRVCLCRFAFPTETPEALVEATRRLIARAKPLDGRPNVPEGQQILPLGVAS